MATDRAERCLLVFAKAPMAGEVKTRLMPLLDGRQAVRFHRRLVRHCLQIIAALKQCRVELWAGSDHSFWLELAQGFDFQLYQQQGDDLGERMLMAMQQALKTAKKVVIIGTDCPFIDADYIEQAFAALDTVDAVLGPAADGGYVLLGLTAIHAQIFQNVSWGSAVVLAQTMQRLQQQALSYHSLATLMDIDRPEDFLILKNLLPQLTDGLDWSAS